MGDVDSSKAPNQVAQVEQMRRDLEDLEDDFDDLYDYVYGGLHRYFTDMPHYIIYTFVDLKKMLLIFVTLQVLVIMLLVIQRSGLVGVGLGLNCRMIGNVSLNGTKARKNITYQSLECSLLINQSLMYLHFWLAGVLAICYFCVVGKKTGRKTIYRVLSAAKEANKDKPEEIYSATAMCQSEKNEATNSYNQDIESEKHSSKQSPPMDFLIPSESEIQEAKEGAEKNFPLNGLRV